MMSSLRPYPEDEEGPDERAEAAARAAASTSAPSKAAA